MRNGKETGSEYKVGKGKPPLHSRFSTDNQPEKNGRPKGSISLSTRIKNMLEEGVELPKSVKETIQRVCGEEKAAVDALILVGLLNALQGDKQWADWLSNNGYGKPVETLKHEGGETPVAIDGTLKVVLVKPKESEDA